MNNRPSVLLVSVDALKPEFVFEQERLGISLPNITKYFVEDGLTAREGMKSVFPTFTYPCHQSMITGTNPVTHGIVNNGIFDPEGKHQGAWHWFVSDKVKNLWQVARENGYCAASVAFPTSVGAQGDYVAPEFWWDGTELDSKFIDMLCEPKGLISEMEKDIGRYAGGLDLSDNGDAQRGKAAMWVLKNKLAPLVSEKPFFMSAYFASFDESAHVNGLYSQEAATSLQKIDVMLGELIEEAKKITDGHIVVCVVSDHGTINNSHNISPNILLAKAGLIDLDEDGRLVDWKAFCQRAGGVGEIRLKNPGDAQAAAALDKAMEELAQLPDNGIYEIVSAEDAQKRGGFPDCAYVLVAEKGYEVREDLVGDYCRTRLTQKAQHGYNENYPEMRASYMLHGEGITPGHIEGVRLIDVAPTLAGIMGTVIPTAEGRDLLK